MLFRMEVCWVIHRIAGHIIERQSLVVSCGHRGLGVVLGMVAILPNSCGCNTRNRLAEHHLYEKTVPNVSAVITICQC